MGLTDVADILWRERETLELLLFKLEEEQLVLAAGRTRWLNHASREVEIVIDRMRDTELLRAAEVEALAAVLDLPPNPSLAALADAVDEPWSSILRDHRAAFMTLTTEITTLAENNRDLLTSGARAAREAVLAVGGAGETYGRRGQTAPAAQPRSRLLDEAM